MRAGRLALVLVLASTVALAGCLDTDDGSGAPGEGGDAIDADPGMGDGSANDSNRQEDDASQEPRQPPEVALEEVASGLELPTLATHAGDGSGRLFVLEQPGRVRVVEDGELQEESYLDLTDRTEAEGERGLLGLAFDPDFADNGRLYVSYTNNEGDSVLARHTVEDPASGRPSQEGTTLLTVEQPYSNHNGGHVAFGPDGYLYYGLGDGGSGGDPENNGQNKSTLLGSMLRLDVSGEELRPAPGNPFVDGEGHDMVWAYGLRNPWRFSFDRATDDLYIGDVGQENWEEVDRQPADSSGGENYGWNRWEGNHAYAGDPAREGYEFPIVEYPLEGERCAVTGGYVYRGDEIPELQGFYLYADFCTGTIWAAQQTSEGWQSETLLDPDMQITSFGEDEAGEVYVVDRAGSIQRIVPG